jgi:hypothetical protein
MKFMKMTMKEVIALVFILIFHVNQFSAQDKSVPQKIADGIRAEELKSHLSVLASDEYEGRETGTRGQKKAAQYIADYYQALGVEPCVNGSWFQSYPLKKVSHMKSNAIMGGKKYEMIKDFYFFSSEENSLIADEIVFVGYGIRDGKHDDYRKTNVQGKTVLCLMGEPLDKKGKSRITGKESYSEWSMDPSLKEDLAMSLGAKNMIQVNLNYAGYMERVRYWLEQAPMRLDNPKRPQEEEGIPTVFVSPEMADEILKSAGIRVKEISKLKKIKSKTLKSDLVFHMERDENKLNAENVLCFIEGTDPILKNEIVVISAHYDHIGIVNGQINNGADDDGSGTSATLELAQAFMEAKNSGNGSRRSILILNVSGEEKGLLGSEWYSDFPVFPLENTVCDLNIDMIGRKDSQHPDENYVYIIGSDKLSTTLHEISENCNKSYTKLALDYTYNSPDDPNRFYYRSDHYNFAKHNIPVIFYFSGVHEDYHKPGDDVEKILFEKMETITKLVFYTAWEVANRDERLKVDVKNIFGGE